MELLHPLICPFLNQLCLVLDYGQNTHTHHHSVTEFLNSYMSLGSKDRFNLCGATYLTYRQLDLEGFVR